MSALSDFEKWQSDNTELEIKVPASARTGLFLARAAVAEQFERNLELDWMVNELCSDHDVPRDWIERRAKDRHVRVD